MGLIMVRELPIQIDQGRAPQHCVEKIDTHPLLLRTVPAAADYEQALIRF